jgi:hypothetical protein
MAKLIVRHLWPQPRDRLAGLQFQRELCRKVVSNDGVVGLPSNDNCTEFIGHLGSGIIADKLSKAGLSWGCVAAVDSEGRTIWIVDARRGDGKRCVVRADEKLTAFVELEAAILQLRKRQSRLH